MEGLYKIYLTGIPLGASPDALTAAAPGPALFDHQSGSHVQAALYAANPAGSYFPHNPNHLQYPVRQERRPPSGPKGQNPYRCLNTNNFVSSPPPPPYQLMHHNEERGAVAEHRSLGRYVCICGEALGRRADLARHLESSRKHNKDPRGPACPVGRCSHTSKFTRADNFKVHYMKQHGASSDEADAYIREWRNRGMP